MNKQFDKLLEGCPGCPLYLSDSEQQVWLDAQRAMLEVGYCKIEPQQPDKRLEQKVRGLLDRLGEGVFRNKAYLNIREDVLTEILALLQPQQPEGELVSMDITDNIIVEELGSAVERIRNIIRRVKEAQLDHVLAQGYVRLPSAKRAADIVEALDKEFPPLSDTRLAGLELIKLLKGEAKQ